MARSAAKEQPGIEITVHWVKINVPKIIQMTVQEHKSKKRLSKNCHVNDLQTQKANFYD